MHRKIPEVRRKGKDKAKDHFHKTGKYDGKSTRRITAFFDLVKDNDKIKIKDKNKIKDNDSVPVKFLF